MRSNKTKSVRSFVLGIAVAAGILFLTNCSYSQNYERYKPLEIQKQAPKAELPEPTNLPIKVEDDRALVKSLDAVLIVDHVDQVDTSPSIDELEGIHYKAKNEDSLFFQSSIRSIIQAQLKKPLTLRQVNGLARSIIQEYRRNKQPIVDVVIPEQRITGGTLQIVIIESRIGQVAVNPGTYFNCYETRRWIECTQPGQRIYEPRIENDLFWMNRNPFLRTTVDFKKGSQPGTTDVIYNVKDIRPIRFYSGIDDSGVESLNFGRFFAGFQYGNMFGRAGTLGYQYTTDEEFQRLEAHSLNYSRAINRDYSFLTFGSWASVSPDLGPGLTQDGESYQLGMLLTRNLIQNRKHSRELNAGIDFKATDNNLEFAGSTISASTADLFQLRFGFRDIQRTDSDQFRLFSLDTFIGPGGGLTSNHSAAAFQTLRPDTSPDYIYSRLRYQRQRLVADRHLFSVNVSAQASSERLLFSETLGLGGFDTIRGVDQRQYNADHGWIANIELGPRTFRWGCDNDPRSLRVYSFLDLGNGYIDNPLPGEDNSTFAISTGVGARLQVSDRITGRIDYGAGIQQMQPDTPSDRFHFGLTWIPGRRWE